MKLIYAAIFFGLSCACGFTYADFLKSKSYVGGGIAQFDARSDYFDDGEFITGYAKFGSRFGQYSAIELRLGEGLNDADIGNSIELSVDQYYGLYYLGRMPVSSIICPYVLVGYTYTDMKLRSEQIRLKEEESDFSLGFGIEIDATSHWTINLEYARYLDTENRKVFVPSVGMSFFY